MTDTRPTKPRYRRPAIPAPTRPTQSAPGRQAQGSTSRHVNEVLELDRECELGSAGERAVVTALEGDNMTLVFPYRVAERRLVRTGADYEYLRGV